MSEAKAVYRECPRCGHRVTEIEATSLRLTTSCPSCGKGSIQHAFDVIYTDGSRLRKTATVPVQSEAWPGELVQALRAANYSLTDRAADAIEKLTREKDLAWKSQADMAERYIEAARKETAQRLRADEAEARVSTLLAKVGEQGTRIVELEALLRAANSFIATDER